MKAALAALGLMVATSGCASARSCPAMYLSPGVHVDATAWVGKVPLDQPTLRATICVGHTCKAANPITHGRYDVFIGMTLPKDKATVRVQLTLSTGRTLDQTATGQVRLGKPFGSGCGGREEIDLTVTKAGALEPGETAGTG